MMTTPIPIPEPWDHCRIMEEHRQMEHMALEQARFDEVRKYASGSKRHCQLAIEEMERKKP